MTPRFYFAVLLLTVAVGCAAAPSSMEQADRRPWSVRMSASTMRRHPDPVTLEGGSRALPKWSYSTAFLIHAIAQAGAETDRPDYLDYAKRYMDAFLDESG